MHYKFLIYISYSYAIPIGNPLEEEINRRGDSIMWFSDLNEGKLGLQNKTNVLGSAAAVIKYKPDIILVATDSVPDFFNALKVQVFHGFNAEKRPDKNNIFAHFRIRGFFDLYCTQGPNTTNGFITQSKKHQHFEVIETGWPKVDPLFPLTKKIINEFPTIMIASTFTERLSLAYNEAVYIEIERLTKTEKYSFIMVLHPKLPQHIITKWKALSNSFFKFYDTTDLVPLYKKADVMFADTTSAIQEFLLQKKPVVTFNHTIPQDYLINCTEYEHIENAINSALLHPKELMQNIENYINELHPYVDGQSSRRIIDASISFLHQDKSHLKSKPLNLVRKYKMRKRLQYFTLKSYNKPFTIRPNY